MAPDCKRSSDVNLIVDMLKYFELSSARVAFPVLAFCGEKLRRCDESGKSDSSNNSSDVF